MLIKHWSCCYDHIITLVTHVTFKVYNDNDKFVKIKENEEIEPNFGSMPSMIHTLIQFWLTLFFQTVSAGSLFGGHQHWYQHCIVFCSELCHCIIVSLCSCVFVYFFTVSLCCCASIENWEKAAGTSVSATSYFLLLRSTRILWLSMLHHISFSVIPPPSFPHASPPSPGWLKKLSLDPTIAIVRSYDSCC